MDLAQLIIARVTAPNYTKTLKAANDNAPRLNLGVFGVLLPGFPPFEAPMAPIEYLIQHLYHGSSNII
jgi:hypothetical protein